MCSIGGFSLSKSSRINPRHLSNALLTEMDIRGNQASGYAFQSAKGSGVFKNDVAGAKLNLKGMARSARDVILHTRYATHGSTRDMANNHPIQSPDKSVALVHNGVIYNHSLVRKSLDFKLPEVDTSVIPAILQQFDRDTNKFNMLDGDASVAWLDENDLGTLRLARVSHSPLVVAQVKDGSFIFASTESILMNALSRVGLKAIFLETVSERKLLTVRAGRLDGVEDLPELDPMFEEFSGYSYDSYRNMTSGGYKPSTTSYKPANARVSGYGRMGKYESAFGEVYYPSDWEYAGDERSFADDDYPTVAGLSVNLYGEYFDADGAYVGSVEDLLDWGFIDYDGSTRPWSDTAPLVSRTPSNFAGGVYGLWE